MLWGKKTLLVCYISRLHIFKDGSYKCSSLSAIADISKKFLPLISLPSFLLPPPSVCHPPPARPPARLLLQTQLRGSLDPAETPHRCECDPWRPHLVHPPIKPLAFSFLLLLLLLLLLSPPLQHHCSILHPLIFCSTREAAPPF